MSRVERPLVFESSWNHGLYLEFNGTEYMLWWLWRCDITLNGNQILILTSPHIEQALLGSTPKTPPPTIHHHPPISFPTSTSCTFVSNWGTWWVPNKSTNLILGLWSCLLVFGKFLWTELEIWKSNPEFKKLNLLSLKNWVLQYAWILLKFKTIDAWSRCSLPSL